MQDLIAELIMALREQTEAISALAESNRELVDAMLASEEYTVDETATTTLLDGSCR